jgi:hypothetical protein
MRIRRLYYLSLLGLQGCAGALGGTNSFVLDVEPTQAENLQYVIDVGTIDVADDANELDSVGTYHVGKLDQDEIADIRKSLTRTLGNVSWQDAAAGKPALDVHIMFTRYYVAHSNNDGAILACVDWALANGRNDVAYAERFFTSIQADDVKGLNTLGAVKNMLNAAVVRRVADRSLAYSAGTPDPATIAVPHTYSTIEEAATPLPERLTSLLGLPAFSTKSMHWTEKAASAPFDWNKYLAELN